MRMNRIVRQFKQDSNSLDNKGVVELFEDTIFHVQKILNVTKLATKANFDLATNLVHDDIIQFIEEYFANFNDLSFGWGVKLEFSNPQEIEQKISFRPAEISMLVDNLIDNAGKADAKSMLASVLSKDGKIVIYFVDDGCGLTKCYPTSMLFEKGISTTSGSGIGLSHARQIVEDLGGTINIENLESGTRVTVEFSE